MLLFNSVKHVRGKGVLREEERRDVKTGSGSGGGNTDSGESGKGAGEGGAYCRMQQQQWLLTRS